MSKNLIYLVTLIFGVVFWASLLPKVNQTLACWNDSDCPETAQCAANCAGVDYPKKQGHCRVCKSCADPTSVDCDQCSASCGGGTQTCVETGSDGYKCATWKQKCGQKPCCTPDCTGKNCGSDGCTGSCGTCSALSVCQSGVCCVNVAPAAPSIVSPANGAQVRVGVATVLDWTDTTNWGLACVTPNNHYEVCISSNQTACDIANWTSTGATSQRSWTPTTADTYVTWQPRSHNGVLSTAAPARSVCVEGFSATNPAYVSAWSVCSASHQRTRTCREDCGTDDCAPVSISEDCTGRVRGSIFDASDYLSCPAFDPATGYLIGITQDLAAVNHGFGFTDQSSTPPHPWAPLSPITTDNNGNYSIRVYAPSTYVYDFSSFTDIFITTGGPKLTCTASTAVVPGNNPACLVQPCTLVNNMSFGFWKKYQGWWQVVGGSVYAQSGIKSGIPRTLAAADQVLIKPDTANGNRLGFLSYGITRPSDIFGTNTNAKASSSLWEAESKYSGPQYDWNYYHTRFNQFPTTTWDGGAISYDDQGRGYQILRYTGDVTSFSFNPAGAQKLIMEIDGNVTVTGNIVVPSGAFLAIISSGTITFDPAMSRADGWYVADNISIPCHDVGGNGCDRDDSQFLGNGSFIGWYGITMTRDRDVINNSASSSLFSYREDLYTNAPEPLRVYAKLYRPFVP